jgi:hypothetical protein
MATAPSKPRRRNRGTGNRPNADEQLRMVGMAVQARRDGATWQAAADAAGYADRSNCQKAVLAFLRDNAVETIEEHRSMATLRYERLMRTLMPLALGTRNPDGTVAIPPDLDAAKEVRMLTTELSRLNGAIMPTKVEVTTELDAEIKRLAELLAVEDTDITSVEVGEEV